MELNEALLQISVIREQIARTQNFHGYRAHTTAFSGVVAIITAIVQAWWHPAEIAQHLLLWVAAAGLSVIVVVTEMIIRQTRDQSELQREQTYAVARQFLPCVVSGALLTFVLVQYAEDVLWLLPGLWAVLFSLGVFASRSVLPRGTGVVAAYYLLSGLLAITFASGDRWAISPWQMISTFGIGQLLAAGVLWWSCERKAVELDDVA